MADINRTASPMHVFEEDLSETRKATEIRKNDLFRKQHTKSPFVLGTIEEVNRKIAKLDRRFQNYTGLVCETRSTDNDDDFLRLIPPSSAKGRDMYEKKVREKKELDIFSGFYSIQQTLGNPPTERVKNISKISLHPTKPVVKKQDSSQPKFVELHQYPGFDPSELTLLPYEVNAKNVLEKVSRAQEDLKKKPHYKPQFEKLFYSQMSQAILQDIFWYYFLETFGSNRSAQEKLFNRVAHNFVKLMTYANNPQYKEVFLKDYPSLMSQAVYASYCHVFPDSFKQFGEVFKEKLVFLVWEWMAGIRPAPRTWMKWNFIKLEPPNIRMREEMMANSKKEKKAAALNLDYLEQLDMSNQSIYSSSNSLTSHASHRKKAWNKSSSRKKDHTPTNKSISGSDASSVIDTVADAQAPTGLDTAALRLKDASPSKGRKFGSNNGVVSVQAVSGKGTGGDGASQKSKKTNKMKLVTRDPQEGLSPIRETYNEEEVLSEADVKEKRVGISQATVHPKVESVVTMWPQNGKRESAPTARSCDFVKSVFNVHGQSPLVAHFLRMRNLRQDVGTTLRVQRTEIENLPSLDSQTYDDLIKECFKNVKENVKNYKESDDKYIKDGVRFSRRQKHLLREFKFREAALLSNPKEVKRLAALLILEQRKDSDSIPANADAAIEAALIAQGATE